MPDTVRIGIAGAGVIGNVHGEAISGIDAATVVAVAEPREDAGQALASRHDARWYASYNELLTDDDVELVILATPSGLHSEQTVLAAQAGKNIITEKPMAITAKGLDRMIDAVDEHKVELAVIFQNRLSPEVIKVKRAVEAGMIGRPIFGNAYVHWHRTQDYYEASGGWRGTWGFDGGGALINQSIHTIDLLQWILGGISSVSAQTATLVHDIETEDTASASVKFRSGALGLIQGATTTGKDWPVKVEVVGTGGKAVLEKGKVTFWEGDSSLTDDLLTPLDREFAEGWTADEPFGISHRRQLSLIVDALRNGETPPFPGREARKAVDIILGIYESARQGTRIKLS